MNLEASFQRVLLVNKYADYKFIVYMSIVVAVVVLQK